MYIEVQEGEVIIEEGLTGEKGLILMFYGLWEEPRPKTIVYTKYSLTMVGKSNLVYSLKLYSK